VFNRNPWTSSRLELLPRSADPFYSEDGLWTYRRHAFTTDARFESAYKRAIQASGRDYEMRWRAHTLLWAAEAAARVEGAFVECGTGRGFMASAICSYLEWGARPFYLFDTFLPTRPDSGGTQTPSGTVDSNYAAGPDAVTENFAEWPGVKLVVGKVPESLVGAQLDRIAFLHVDLNHAPAEAAAVRFFWPRLGTGGIVVFDDYGWERNKEAADSVGKELGFSVLTLPTGQGLVVKT
jgi:hypothetical protein